MNKNFLIRLLPFLTLFILILNIQQLNACPSCYGNAQSSRIDGMNAAIFSMVGIIGLVLTGITSFFFRMVKRSDKMDNANLITTYLEHKGTN